MSYQMPAGIAYFQFFWPNYKWSRPRKHQFAVLHASPEHGEVTITSSTGERWTFPYDASGYESAAAVAAKERLTVLCRFNEGADRFPWLYSASHDPKAKIMLSERQGPMGVNVKRGRTHGIFISEAVWHRQEIDNGQMDDAAFLALLERVAATLGVGVYDSAAGLGTATLYRYWEQSRLRHITRLPSWLEWAFLEGNLGGRVETEGIGGFFPSLYESDIKSAYPTAVAQGLPWGRPGYCHKEPKFSKEKPWYENVVYFGEWRITVSADIAHSPIPAKDRERRTGKATWSLHPGTFIYNGWNREIEALRATGAASAEWLGGWCFLTLSTALAPWVEEMAHHRDAFTRAGDERAASLVKLATNAAIGRWGMDPARLELVDLEHAQVGDGGIEFPSYFFADAPDGVYPQFLLHKEPRWTGPCVPLHWSSYTKMVVRMEVYARSQAARDVGYTVVSVNFDAVIATGPIPVADSPFKWKELKREDATIPYPRAIVSWVESEARSTNPDGTPIRSFVRVLPGMAQAMQLRKYPQPPPHQKVTQTRCSDRETAREGPEDHFPGLAQQGGQNRTTARPGSDSPGTPTQRTLWNSGQHLEREGVAR